MGNSLTFTLTEVAGMLGGLISLLILVCSYYVKRTVYKEIDDLKKDKQDKPHCPQQKALCGQEISSICGDVEEIKTDMKEGRKEFSQLNRKMERVMTKMKIRYDDLNGG